MICQGSPFARNISLTIFLYMFLVLLLFALVKKKEYFKCTKHSHKQQDIAAIATEVSYLRSLMVDKSGIEFKVFYLIMKFFFIRNNFCSLFTLNVMKTRTLTQ